MATTTSGLVRRPAKEKTARPAWQEKPSFLIRAIKLVVLVLICLVMLYPFVYVIANSFAAAKGAFSSQIFPTHFTLAAYRTILSSGIITHALLISIGVTVIGTVLSVFLTVLMAYGLSRTKDVPGSRFILFVALFTMLFDAGVIPNFLLVKSLGLIDNYAALLLVLPGVVSAFNLVVVRNFFMQLPRELSDSARIDGASEWQILWRVVLPLSKAVIAVIALLYGVAYWGDFFAAMIYMNDTHKWPIQLVLQQYVLVGTPMDPLAQGNPALRQTTSQTIQMAIVVLSTVPILIVYPFLQRFFTKGVLTGAIKG